MSLFRLWFHNRHSVELSKTEFICTLTKQEFVTVRGSSGCPQHGYSTFKWSSAVQALVLLVLKQSALELKAIPYEEACLKGQAKSPASSLDYALTKQPTWLVDMFGVDKFGTSILRRFVRRINPERKRPGPVVLHLLCENLCIEIFVNEMRVTDSQTLLALIQKIQTPDFNSEREFETNSNATTLERTSLDDCCGKVSENENTAEATKLSDFDSAFRDLVLSEICTSLRHTNIFNPQLLHDELKSIYESPSYQKVCKKEIALLSSIDMSLSRTQLLGMCQPSQIIERLSKHKKPMRFSMSPAQVGALAILLHLKHKWGLSIEIDYLNIHTVEITRRILKRTFPEEVDFCAVSIAPAWHLAKARSTIDYEPLLFLPKTSYRVIVPDRTKKSHYKINEGRYCLLGDESTSSTYFLEELIRRGFVKKSKITVSDLEPDQVFLELQNDDRSLQAVQWFPHYHLNCLFNQCSIVQEVPRNLGEMQTVLFMNKAFGYDKERVMLLDIAIRAAWLELCENTDWVLSTTNNLLADGTFLKFTRRIGGLYTKDFSVSANAA